MGVRGPLPVSTLMGKRERVRVYISARTTEGERVGECVHVEMTLLSDCCHFFTSNWTRQASVKVNAILSRLSSK